MKICQIIYTYPPYITGGADIYAERISKELVKKGHEVVVITTKPFDGLSSLKTSVEMDDVIKVHRFYPLNIFSWINTAEKSIFQKMIWNALDIWNLHPYLVIKNILKKEKPDVVHIHTPIWFSLSVFDAVKSLKIPSVFMVHDYLLLCRRTLLLHSNGEICHDPHPFCKMYQFLSKKIVKKKPDMIIAPSQFILDILSDNGFFEGSKSIKIPLGVIIEGKKPEKEYETIDIMYVGSLVNHKGVYILIEAFKNIENKNIKLHILGKGTEEYNLKEMAKDDGRIMFHGFVEGKELRNFHENTNMVVVPSICYDNSPMVIYESLMNGTPVIGSKIGGIPELIEEGVNGFLFEPGSVSELKDRLQYLIENPSILKKLENGAFESSNKYSMVSHIEKLENMYKELIRD
ncbi:MAG: glycosyltransferase family 4 protein [Methanobacterium sp.]|nr:glycosyltransferase family 4 protein [Methanobacterium sp.]